MQCDGGEVGGFRVGKVIRIIQKKPRKHELCWYHDVCMIVAVEEESRKTQHRGSISKGIRCTISAPIPTSLST